MKLMRSTNMQVALIIFLLVVMGTAIVTAVVVNSVDMPDESIDRGDTLQQTIDARELQPAENPQL